MKPLHLIGTLVLLVACHNGPPPLDPALLAAAERTVRPNTTTFVTDGDLATGIYFVVDSGYGYPRTGVDYSDRPKVDPVNGYSTLYIDPTPIVTPANFTRVEVSPIRGSRSLTVDLNPVGVARWYVAMRLAMDKQIAIVAGDSVMSNPIAYIDLNSAPPHRVPLDLGRATDGEVALFVQELNALREKR
jgi:hypothetical protein